MDNRVFFILLFVLSGTANVILVKWISLQSLEGSNGKLQPFQHPVILTFLMFLGECLAFCVYKVVNMIMMRRSHHGSDTTFILTSGSTEINPFCMLLPSFIRSIASILLFTGLYLTYASSFQMIRSVALIFLYFPNAMYMNQTLTNRWLAIITIACGTVAIICSDLTRIVYDDQTIPYTDRNAILTGDLLIVMAEVLQAYRYIYEEKQLKTFDLVPIRTAGWQGLFGIIITLGAAICLNFLPSVAPFNENSRGVFDDLSDLLPQLHDNTLLITALISFTCISGIYNAVGMSIAKFSSSTNRLVADGIRIYLIWAFVIFAEWEIMNLITLLGLFILQMGIIMYRHAIIVEWYRPLLARWQRSRYVDITANTASTPNTQAADVI